MAGVMYPNIEKRRADLGVSKVKMAERLGLSIRGLEKKLTGESEFTAREVRELALWWGNSADELMADVKLTTQNARVPSNS